MRCTGERRATSRQPFSARRPARTRSAPRCAPAARRHRRGQRRAVELDRPGHVAIVRPRHRGRRVPVTTVDRARDRLAATVASYQKHQLQAPARSPGSACSTSAGCSAGRTQPDARRPRRRDHQGRAARPATPPASPRRRSTAWRRYFAQQNSGKRNVSLDMNKPEAKEIILALAERCDVLIENFRPGVADADGHRLRGDRGAQPAHRLRLDQRLRADRPVGRAQGVRLGRGRRGRLRRLAGRRPRRRRGQRPVQPRRRLHRDGVLRRRSSPRCSSASAPGVASTSTCRWPR